MNKLTKTEKVSSRSTGLMKFIGSGLLSLLFFAALHPTNGNSRFGILLTSVPVVVMFIGFIEVVTGSPIQHIADQWDSLQGWQRGILGIVIVISFLALFMLGVALFA